MSVTQLVLYGKSPTLLCTIQHTPTLFNIESATVMKEQHYGHCWLRADDDDNMH